MTVFHASHLPTSPAPPPPRSPAPLLPCSPAPVPLRSCWLLGLLAFFGLFAAACTSSPSPASDAQEPAAAAKVSVSEDGMYELTAADLEQAGLGWRDVDPTQLRLFYRGDQQPLWIQGEGDKLTLRFYGQASRSPYARDNVYWLELEPGSAGDGETRRQGDGEMGGPFDRLRTAQGDQEKGEQGEGETGRQGDSLRLPLSPSPCLPCTPAPPHRPAATVRIEENWLYSPQVKEGDHWFWASLPAPQVDEFDIILVGVASGSGRLRLEVWASTGAPASPDHHLRISVNGRRVADESWDGRGRHLIEADVPAGRLREGDNVVSIEAPGDTGVAADIVFIDWIEISYPRLLVARADRLSFDSPGGVRQLAGFTGPVSVFDVTDPEAVTRVAGIQEEQQGDRTVVAFQGEPGRRYLTVGPKGFLRPTRVARANTAPDLRASGNGADYVAIGPPDLLEPLQPLLDWRKEQGLRVMAVPVGAVYDQFNYGLSEPEAIRAFLKYAVQSWQPAPRYLLLVGDATYDPRGYVAPPEANRLPSFLIPTIYGGETASDVRFVQLDGDLKPDLAVGRMPARTPQQVRILVEKTLGYERQAAEGEWRHRVLTVADGQDPSFRTAAEAFIEQFPAGYQAVRVFPDAGATDAHLEVTRQLDEGNLLVAYFGHGSVTQWGKDRIFTTADGAALTNGDRVPVVLNMTCLTGLFTHPKVDSLAETLLWQAGGGAVAVLAPTSLTLAGDQSFLSRPLVKALLRDRIPTLGQAVLQAQRQVPTDSAGTRDVMQTFLLFGDPALRLAHP